MKQDPTMQDVKMKVLRVAVRSLVEHCLRSGDLVLESWEPRHLIDGVRAHQEIQKSWRGAYLKEVPVFHRVVQGNLTLEIQGRIDGVHQKPDEIIIEEIKSTGRELDSLQREEGRLHWGQAKIYAYIYCIEHDLQQIGIRLTYFHLKSKEIREDTCRVSRQELEIFFREVVDCYLSWQQAIEQWREERNEAIRQIRFPFSSHRPGQRQMMAEVRKALGEGGRLFVQAPTGIGKTMAVVLTTLRSMSEGEVERTFYLTARTTGKRAAEKALAVLRHQGLRLKSLTVTAKEKICFNPGKACNGEECEFARGFYDRLEQALEELLNHDDFGRRAVEEVSRKHRICPFEFSIELSRWADWIICDYNHVFHPSAFLRRALSEEGGDYIFLVDEAHQLVDRSREMYSAPLREESFRQLDQSFGGELPWLCRSVGRIQLWFAESRRSFERTVEGRFEAEPPTELYPLLEEFLEDVEGWFSLYGWNGNARGRKVLEVYFDVSRFLKVAQQYDESYATLRKTWGEDLYLKLFCMDPSGQLKKALARCRSAIFFSATLSPIGFFKRSLGCEESAETLVLSSPFPSENLCVLLSDRISTTYRRREETKGEVARYLASFVGHKKGNYLLFFPSYQYMRMVHECFRPFCFSLDTLVQTPEMTEPDRETFLGKFSEEYSRTLVGFAVMGGIFAEGVDLVGDRLTGAAIVGVGLPGISPERELIRDYFGGDTGAGFDYAYRYPGIIRVLQAAGRVIRSETDRGAVLLIDERFSQSRYRTLLPREWSPMRVRSQEQLSRVLGRFWGEHRVRVVG